MSRPQRVCLQAATGSEEAFDIGKKERARLRLQAKVKKQQLDSLRSEQNADTALGEVRQPPGTCKCCLNLRASVVYCCCCRNGPFHSDAGGIRTVILL